MLLVFGSSYDVHPRRLVEHWTRSGREVALVSPAELSRAGWRLRRGDPGQTRAAAGDRVVAGADISGVVNALASIGPHDLPHVVEGDREYVAQEMTAFLLAWLQELDCPVVDRPTTRSLAGCGRSSFEWAAIAGSVGIPAAPRWEGPTSAVTVVGGRAVDAENLALADAAETVSRVADRRLATLRFTTDDAPRLVTAESRPQVGRELVAERLLGWLEQQ
jgi:hypothetical protein